MKKFKKLIVVSLLLITMTGFLAGCRQSTKVSHNISQEADNFNVVRRVAVINVLTDKVEFEVIGNISIETSDGQIDIIAEVADGVYKKHLVNINEFNMYVVEDLYGAEVGKYKYEVNYMPESLIPFDVIQQD